MAENWQWEMVLLITSQVLNAIYKCETEGVLEYFRRRSSPTKICPTYRIYQYTSKKGEVYSSR